jgi:ATP-dependent DNA ligase
MRCGADAGVMRRWLYAFDLIEHNGDDLCDLPLIEQQAAARQTARHG